MSALTMRLAPPRWNAMCQVLLSLMLLFPCIVSSLQKPINATEMGILETLYDSTGGEFWNYDTLTNCTDFWYNGTTVASIGRHWNFTKSAEGVYLEDPCPTDASPPFQGVNCSCDATTCHINAIVTLCGNLRGEIPVSLGRLSHLTYIDFYNNSLKAIPESFFGLTDLEYTDLSINALQQQIPDALGQLTKLTYLDLSYNALSGTTIPQTIGHLTSLTFFAMINNSLIGGFDFTTLTNMKFMDFRLNSLRFSLESISVLKQLNYLEMSGNQLTSSIPSSIGDLTDLTFLSLRENALTGQIPSSIGSLANLVHLDLSNNSLSGAVPWELSKLANLSKLFLQDNLLGSSGTQTAFGFINPAIQRNLHILDVSSNGFSGTLPESIFALPSLEIFAAGSNCLSGELPANICDAKNMQTLVLSGLSSGTPCRRYFWKGRISKLMKFDGFGAEQFMQGSLPQCIYGLPNLRKLNTAGNSFLGQAPRDGTSISSSLQTIDVSRNKLTGFISKEIAAAMANNGPLTNLNMSYNRIEGTLEAFSSSKSRYNATSALSLEVNRLSGPFPASLGTLQYIHILTGNVFECLSNKADLPINDTPAMSSYQCGSDPMNRMMYGFAFVLLVLFVLWETLHRRSSFRLNFRVMRHWLEAADGARLVNMGAKTVEIRRYCASLRDWRRFTTVIGSALIVVLIVYGGLSGDDYRMIEHPKLWVTTAAYLQGSSSAGWLLFIGMGMTMLTSYLVMEDVRRAKTADANMRNSVTQPEVDETPEEVSFSAKAPSTANYSWWMRTRIHLLPFFRILFLVTLSWGMIGIGNIFYLRILLTGKQNDQETYKFFFAAFKLVWTQIVTPLLFKSKWLFFGVEEVFHHKFIKYWLRGEVNMMIFLNAISTFGIPLFVIMVEKSDCFNDVFKAVAPFSVDYVYNTCFTIFPDGTCAKYHDPVVNLRLEVPFLYNYTCSFSIIRTYVPLFQQMFMILILISSLQLVYLCADITASEAHSTDEMSGGCTCFENMWRWFVDTLVASAPTGHLLLNSSQRLATCKDGTIFSGLTRIWITDSLPTLFGSVLVLVTFGVWAPLLAAMASVSIILDTFVAQLVMGRFLTTELGVLHEHRNPASTVESVLTFSAEKRANFAQDVEDADKPWGALAVLKEVEDQCSHFPQSSLSQGRTALVIVSSLTMAFLILDVANSIDNGRAEPTYWFSVLIVCFAGSLEIASRIYKRCFLGKINDKKSSTSTSATSEGMELTTAGTIVAKKQPEKEADVEAAAETFDDIPSASESDDSDAKNPMHSKPNMRSISTEMLVKI